MKRESVNFEKQPKYTLIGEWLNKLWPTHTREYTQQYIGIKY